MVNVWVEEGYKPRDRALTSALSVFTDEAKHLASQAKDIVDFTIKRVEELAEIWEGVVARANGK
jgi:hypothetical protein